MASTKLHLQAGARTFAVTSVKVGDPVHLKKRCPVFGRMSIVPQSVQAELGPAVFQTNCRAWTWLNCTFCAVTVIVSKVWMPCKEVKVCPSMSATMEVPGLFALM